MAPAGSSLPAPGSSSLLLLIPELTLLLVGALSSPWAPPSLYYTPVSALSEQALPLRFSLTGNAACTLGSMGI